LFERLEQIDASRSPFPIDRRLATRNGYSGIQIEVRKSGIERRQW